MFEKMWLRLLKRNGIVATKMISGLVGVTYETTLVVVKGFKNGEGESDI